MSLAVLSLRQIIDNTLRNVYPIIYGELVIHHVKQVVYLSKDPDTHRLCYEYFCLAWVDSAPCRLFCGDVDFFPVTLTILQREYQRETDGADYVLQVGAHFPQNLSSELDTIASRDGKRSSRSAAPTRRRGAIISGQEFGNDWCGAGRDSYSTPNNESRLWTPGGI